MLDTRRASQSDSYFESKVLTAPPHRLHLMLIEGALRSGSQANDYLARGDHLAASAALLRVVDIIAEMLVGVRHRQSDLNQYLSALYLFLFRRASEAKINADPAALADVLRLLEFERQTWQQVCERFGEAAGAPPAEVGNNGFSLNA